MVSWVLVIPESVNSLGSELYATVLRDEIRLDVRYHLFLLGEFRLAITHCKHCDIIRGFLFDSFVLRFLFNNRITMT